jgi:hypothetical protein
MTELQEAWACGVVDRAPVCHLGDLGSNLGPANISLKINGFVETHTLLQVKTGQGES